MADPATNYRDRIARALGGFPLPEAERGIRALHGSPKKFGNFDDRYIGTGDDSGDGRGIERRKDEGGDEGWGHYFTDSAVTADRYAREAYRTRDSLPRRGKGYIHDVDLMVHPDQVLDDDKPYAEQSAIGKRALYNMITGGSIIEDDVMNPELNPAWQTKRMPRRDYRGNVVEIMDVPMTARHIQETALALNGAKAVAKQLSENGVPVRRYSNHWDNGNNYVVADTDIIKKRGVFEYPNYRGMKMSPDDRREIREDRKHFD